MIGPFPGMDPYLEAPGLWRGLHLQIINNCVADLQPHLVPRYVARPEERVLLSPLQEAFYPDVTLREYGTPVPHGTATAVRPPSIAVAVPEEVELPEWTMPHRFVTIRDAASHQVITVIEVLSPWNKTGMGRDLYRHKQGTVLLSEANLVEIDLLRSGPHSVAAPADRVRPSDYRVCIHRAGWDRCGVVRFSVRDALPDIGIPLRIDDQDVPLRLDAVLRRCYEEGAYGYMLDYAAAPDPPLSPEDAAWARERIRRWQAEAGR